jgi:hypothetical protein
MNESSHVLDLDSEQVRPFQAQGAITNGLRHSIMATTRKPTPSYGKSTEQGIVYVLPSFTLIRSQIYETGK